MVKGSHGSIYIGNSEIKRERELFFLSMVGKQGHESKLSHLTADPSTLFNVSEARHPYQENEDENAS